jgi:hypothetical protein
MGLKKVGEGAIDFHIICRGAAFRSIIEEENFFGGFIL